MIPVLSAFLAVLTLAWGLNAATIDASQSTLPWLIREQGLYLSGLLAIGLMIGVKRIAREPEAIRLRVIAHALSQAGVNASAAQIAAIDRLVVDWHGQGGVSLPRGYSANRKKHVIRVCQDGAHANR